MGKVRPLFIDWENTHLIPYQLTTGWQDAMLRQQPSTLVVSPETLGMIEKWVRWYIDEMYRISFSVDHKTVIQYLDKVEKAAQSALRRRSPSRLK